MNFKKNLAFFAILIFCWWMNSAEAASNPEVKIQTSLGDIIVEVYKKQAPVTAKNFLRYVDHQIFKNGKFYRVVRMNNQPENKTKIQVIQGGLGLEEMAELKRLAPIKHETTQKTGILHNDGVISMARLEPGTASSEFFICIGDQPELDFGGKRNADGQGFAAFGKIISGMGVVRKIQRQKDQGQMLIKPIAIENITRL